MSSFAFAFSSAKSTSAWKALMSPAASAWAWADSRHQAGLVSVVGPGVPGSGSWALKRKRHVEEGRRRRGRPATSGLRRGGDGPREQVGAARLVPQPHARRESHGGGARIPLAVRNLDRDLPAGEVDRTAGAGPATGSPLLASVSTAVSPWTVRK